MKVKLIALAVFITIFLIIEIGVFVFFYKDFLLTVLFGSGIPKEPLNPSFELTRSLTNIPQYWYYGPLFAFDSDDQPWDVSEFYITSGYTGNALKANLDEIDSFHKVKSNLFALDNKMYTLTFYMKPEMIGNDPDSGFDVEIFITDSSNNLIVDWAIVFNNDNIRKEEWLGADILDIDVSWEDVGNGWKKVNVEFLDNFPKDSKARLYLEEYRDRDYTGTVLIDEISFEVV